MIVLHGRNDPRVPVQEAEQIVSRLGALGSRRRIGGLRRRGPPLRQGSQPDLLLPRDRAVPRSRACLDRSPQRMTGSPVARAEHDSLSELGRFL